jgi:DNA helicase-2/ATP-dependent DNA helicase PcrA
MSNTQNTQSQNITQDQIFQKRFEKLNPEQKKAVETIEGPVMVVAGPGTGKTETLGARIANILQKTDSLPHNILCLTFTNAGVVAMRKRLIEFIGPDAQKVEIHTFHSFCNKIIQENTEIFSQTRDEENISELEQREIIDEILDSLPLENPFFSHTNSYYYAKPLLDFFAVIKSEKWTSEFLQKKSQEYLDELPSNEKFQYQRKYTNKKTGETFQKGDINPAKIKPEEKKIEKLLAATNLFERYQDEMKKRGRYDFNDMILWVLKKFTTDENLLAEYQEQFQYILVDEFQDTNGSQKELIDLLISYWDSPNIFVVGDDDQSIYRFQGANMRNIIDFFSAHEKSIQTVTLTKNYRSTQSILDVAERVIARNTERLVSEIDGLNKHLTAENPEIKKLEEEFPEKFSPKCIGYYNEIHEQLGIFEKIKAMHQNGENLSKVAVIYSKHRQAADLISLCEQEKIPVRVKETQNILDLPLAKFIVEMLKYFEKEKNIPFSGEDILYKMMYFPFWNIAQADIALVTLAMREMRRKEYPPLRGGLGGSEEKKSPEKTQEKNIFEEIPENSASNSPCSSGASPSKRGAETLSLKTLLIAEDLPEKIPHLKNPDALKNFSQTILKLEGFAHTKPLTGFVEHLLYDTKILEWIFSHQEKPYLMRIISTFFSFVREEHQKKPKLDIGELLEIFARMDRHDIKLSIQKILYEKEGVNFITAHSSKGLEFDTVFVMGVNKKDWDKKRANTGIAFPSNITLSNEGDHLEETRRLFFVALTRAKKNLEISFSQKDLNGKDLDSSIFITETGLSPVSKMYDEEDILNYQRKLFTPVAPEKITLLDEKYLQDILENYSLSATHINKYLQCPRAFYFENFLRIPKAMNSQMAFGNCIHRVLEVLLIEKNNSGKIPGQAFAEKVFLGEMQKYAYLFEENEMEKKILYGNEVIKNFLANSPKIWEKKSAPEYNIRTAVNGTPINGKLDAVHFLDENGGNTVRVVDYKTGKLSNAKEKLFPPCEKNENQGGDYWRQLVFYKILLENDMRKPWVMEEGCMSFVEGDDKNPENIGMVEKTFSFSAEAVETVKQQIKEVYEKIANFEFEQGCEEENCEWCEFWRNISE